MLKLWMQLYKDNRLIAHHAVDADDMLSAEEQLKEGLRECCYALDLSQPMVQSKHISDMMMHGFTRFLPDSFLEEVSFDRMEVRLFDEKKKKKANPEYI